jgi:hypothetical protein
MERLGAEHRDEGRGYGEPAPQDPRSPAQAHARVPPPIGRQPVAPVDDEHLLGGDDGDDRRRGHAPHAASPRPHLEHRGVVRVVIRQDPLDRAAAATREGEADAMGEPVAGDGARGVEPPALAHCYRHPRFGPRWPAMRNSLP